jgi:hypothetical protein
MPLSSATTEKGSSLYNADVSKGYFKSQKNKDPLATADTARVYLDGNTKNIKI